jgi:alginate O-acetyltransferase complex protein AlgI
MLFQSVEFIFVFLPIAFCGYHLLRGWTNSSVAISFLIVCSVVFYAAHEPIFLILLFGSIICNYLTGSFINASKSKLILTFGILFNLSLLGYFKYAGLIVWSYNESFSSSSEIPNIALPLAISFFTFQQIAYLVDVYRYGKPSGGWLQYTLFVVFFPQLIAGPIVHHAEMIPQFEKVGRFARLRIDIAVGFTIFTIGLGKKIILADSCGVFADFIFGRAAEGIVPAFLESWVGAIAFGLQIYFDFSGYSDMAVGLARLFGIRLPVNFFSPYRSDNIIEFWRRWHITLSRFLRDYLYFPLGGGRKGPTRRYANIMTVMILGGLWHGAGINFIFWGALHGVYIMINHAWRAISPATSSRHAHLFFWLLTLFAVTIAWVPFRAQDFKSTMLIWSGMFGLNGFSLPRTFVSSLGQYGELLLGFGFSVQSDVFRVLYWGAGITNALWFSVALFIALFMPNTYQWVRRLRPVIEESTFLEKPLPNAFSWRPSLVWASLIVVLFCASIYYQAKPSAFLYFQF